MKKELFDSNPILKLSFDFSLMIIEYCEKIKKHQEVYFSKAIT